jgi:hypothetical protein
MNFDPTSLSNFMLILTTWGGLFLAALWLSLIIWTYRDIRARGRDPLGRILAVLVVAVLFLPGIVVYLILRPRHTLSTSAPSRRKPYCNPSRSPRFARVAGAAHAKTGWSAPTAIPSSRSPATNAAS